MPGAPRSYKTFFDLHLYLAEKYCENLSVPRVQLNVNPAWAITWLVSVTTYCTFFNNNSPPPGQFLCTKIRLKKLATVRGMLIEQIFELRGPGAPGRLCNPITGYFHHKTIISKENFRVENYSLLKYSRRQYTLLPPTCLLGPSHLQNLTPQYKILTCFELKLQAKKELNKLIFSIGFQMSKI